MFYVLYAWGRWFSPWLALVRRWIIAVKSLCLRVTVEWFVFLYDVIQLGGLLYFLVELVSLLGPPVFVLSCAC